MSSSSGKKGKVGPFWVDCKNCSRKIPRIIVQKHEESSCDFTYPFIRDQIVYLSITQLPPGSKINNLPFIGTRHSSSTLFVSEEIMKECGFVTFSWVLIRPYNGNRNSEDSLFYNPPAPFRIWPISSSDNTITASLGAYVTESAIRSSPDLFEPDLSEMAMAEKSEMSKKYERKVSIQALRTRTEPFKPFLPLEEATLQIYLEESKFGDKEEDRRFFLRNFLTEYKQRVVTNGTTFKFRFYTETLQIRLVIMTATREVKDKDNDAAIEETFSSLAISAAANNQFPVPEFYEITATTKFRLEFKPGFYPHPAESGGTVVVRLEDVGGLASVKSELINTIQYLLDSCSGSSTNRSSPLSVGIILHGNHGTGKSLLVQAICNYFSMKMYVYQEFSNSKSAKNSSGAQAAQISNNLADLFTRASANSQSSSSAPAAAIIIENLDVYGARIQRSDSNSNFISDLRSQIELLAANASTLPIPVIVLATCTDLDSIDPALRAPHIFGKEIEIPVPSMADRKEILNRILGRVKSSFTEQDVHQLAGQTHGYVGADLANLLAQSNLRAQTQAAAAATDKSMARIGCLEMNHIEECIKSVPPSAMKSILIDVPNVKWEDIGGQRELKLKLSQAIEWPLKHPETFTRLGINPPKGVLMYGPPGCSKTMIAKAIATESGLNFISVKGSELFSKWVGESEKAVRSIFRKARQVSPCIVFFDEIDSVGGERGTSGGGASSVHERVLAQLLIEMDGVEQLKDVTIVAATNRPDIIDPALLRPGRLDRIIYVPLPDAETRKEIFRIHFRKMPTAKGLEVDKLVKLTERYSGAEITALCQEAALKALEEDINSTIVAEPHFLAALELIPPRTSPTQIEFYEKFSQNRPAFSSSS